MNQTSVRRFGSFQGSTVRRSNSYVAFMKRRPNQARIPMPRCAPHGDQGNRAMAKNLKKARRIGRAPKTGTELAISPRRVIVFKPSAILKQRVNGHSPVALREELRCSGYTGMRSGR